VTRTVSGEFRLAKQVHSSILRIPGADDRRVHTAAFLVIRKNEFPAILVEGGFLTNSAEARRIASPAYLDALPRESIKELWLIVAASQERQHPHDSERRFRRLAILFIIR
jgi:N-acetylmuramoyl-L-alanine amidase